MYKERKKKGLWRCHTQGLFWRKGTLVPPMDWSGQTASIHGPELVSTAKVYCFDNSHTMASRGRTQSIESHGVLKVETSNYNWKQWDRAQNEVNTLQETLQKTRSGKPVRCFVSAESVFLPNNCIICFVIVMCFFLLCHCILWTVSLATKLAQITKWQCMHLPEPNRKRMNWIEPLRISRPRIYHFKSKPKRTKIKTLRHINHTNAFYLRHCCVCNLKKLS